ncbi:MAG: PilT/PilU family type 4a pilus ATPase [Blautia sp.]|nr:PilT/PilU family type 4a pilus ATPase [Blautia sp.]
MSIDQIISVARKAQASDIHITSGMDMRFRINGSLVMAPFQLTPEEEEGMILGLLNKKQLEEYENGNDLDFVLKTLDGNRQRVNVFRQQNEPAATIRLLNQKIPTIEELNLPSVLRKLVEERRGLILVTGPTGSGKTTTLASLIQYINETRADHIITIEDPIEYTYENRMSLIHQREKGRDVQSYSSALRSALREDPDIILVGEMRDYETISATLTAAETGHLVLSTLHTTGAAQTIDRIVDVCPGDTQNQVRTQLAGVLKGIITQCLMPTADEMGRIVGTEILLANDAIANLIRENKIHQISSILQTNKDSGMHSLNQDLDRLVRQKQITRDTAFLYSNYRKELMELLSIN